MVERGPPYTWHGRERLNLKLEQERADEILPSRVAADKYDRY